MNARGDGRRPQPEQKADSSTDAQPALSRQLAEWAILIGLAVVVAFVIKTFIVQPFVIPSGSMQPTIEIGDRVLANRFIYRFRPVARGDIIVFEPWTAGQPDLIKRVIAVGGQTIAMRSDGRFTVDGKLLAEPYVTRENLITKAGDLLPYKVPRGTVFVMGDNRNNSGDSRFNGPVPVWRILGEAFVIYWPLNRIRGL